MEEILIGHVGIKDHDFLARDLFSKGIVNTNRAAYLRAVRLHEAATRKKAAEVAVEQTAQQKLNNLSQDVAELKDTVTSLTNTVTDLVAMLHVLVKEK